MSNETDDEPQRMSPLREIMRNATYIFGVFILLWLLLAKHFPEHFSPVAGEPSAAPKATPEPAKTEAASPKALPDAPKEPIPAPAVLQPAPANNEQVLRLETKLAQLADEMGSLKKQLEERSADHQKKSTEWGDKFESQTRQIESLKAELADLQSHGTHQLSAITEFSILKEAARSGEPFESEFQQLEALIKDEQQRELLARLAPFAKSGIPTLRALQEQFGLLLNSALSAPAKGSSLASSLRSLIRIRKEGEFQQGQDDEAVLARAEAKLERGDVASALKELLSLSPPAQDSFSLWVQNAKSTVLARNAMDALQVALLRKPSPLPNAAATPPAQKPAEVKPTEARPQPKPVKAQEPAAAAAPVMDDEELETLFELPEHASAFQTPAGYEPEDPDADVPTDTP